MSIYDDRTPAWKLLNTLGDKSVEYRYAAEWRSGRLIGYVYTGDTAMMVVIPIFKDAPLATKMTDTWFERIRWADGLIGSPDLFILVEVDQVREPEKVRRRAMSRNPHQCPGCKHPSLIMATQVHCTNIGCKHFDQEA